MATPTNNESDNRMRPTWLEAAAVAGGVALLTAVGVDQSIRHRSAEELEREITLENNLSQYGLEPDENGFVTVSDGRKDVTVKVRPAVIGNTPERDTFSEVFLADGGDPAKLPEAIDIATGQLSHSGNLTGAQPGEAAYIPDDLYLPEQPN